MSRKGPQFERDFCTDLSLWWTDGERDDVFWRTAGSGGRATSRSKRGKTTKNHYGDTLATDPIGQILLDTFLFELKRGYSNCSVQDIIDKKKNVQYIKWIDKVWKTCKEAGTKSWVIVIRRNSRESVAIVPDNSFVFDCDSGDTDKIYFSFNEKNYFLFLLKDWLKGIKRLRDENYGRLLKNVT